MGKEEENQKKKKRSTLDKILLGIVVGGAIGSVIGATVSNKEIREKVRQKMCDTSDTIKEIVSGEEKEKKSFWHFLHKFFVRKK